MTIQEWLIRLLSHPATEPLDWETYCVTMDHPTWTALWREIDAADAYEDGLEAGLRLLQATQQHRVHLGERGYQANQILLYRSLLSMLDKADRWHEYLATWEAIRAHTNHCLPGRGDSLTLNDPQYMSFVRRADGGFGIPPLPYGALPPRTIALHFLYPQLRRKALVERKLTQERAGKLFSKRRPVPASALPADEIQARLAQIRGPSGHAGPASARPVALSA